MVEVSQILCSCDGCWVPGHCCKGFQLGDTSLGTGLEVLAKCAEFGLPFVPTGERVVYDEDGEGVTRAEMTCPLLDEDGRCSDYEHRPDLCREFVLASNYLCIHWTPDGKSRLAT